MKCSLVGKLTITINSLSSDNSWKIHNCAMGNFLQFVNEKRLLCFQSCSLSQLLQNKEKYDIFIVFDR